MSWLWPQSARPAQPVQKVSAGRKGLWPVLVLCVWHLGSALMGAQAASSGGDLFDDPVVARGEGFTIKLSELDNAFTAFCAKLALRDRVVTDAERPHIKAQILDGLIAKRLLAKRALPQDERQARERAGALFKEFTNSPPEAQRLRLQLLARGITEEDFRRELYEEELARAVLDREITSQIQITDQEIKDFYEHGRDLLVRTREQLASKWVNDPNVSSEDLQALREQIEQLKKANLAQLEIPERVRVLHVFLTTRDRQTMQELPPNQRRAKRELALKILEQARAGADFAELVKKYSEDRNLAQTGGEYTFTRDAPFAPEFKAASFSLKPGQISDLVTTAFGYHIIKLLERFPASKVPYEEAAPRIRQVLINQHVLQRMPEYLAELRKASNVAVLDPKLQLQSPETEMGAVFTQPN